jgi:mannosyltransferase
MTSLQNIFNPYRISIKARTGTILYPGLILILAFTVRIWGIGSESAWIDEAYSIALAKHSILDILNGTANDQHPPLYYILLHFWMLFGSGVTYARILSVFIGMIHIAQTIRLGHQLASRWIGLGAGLLLALSPIHVWYSQEVRMYILLASLTTASTAFLWDHIKSKRSLSFYVLFSTLALYTHYFAIFVFLAQGVIILLLSWGMRRPKLIFSWGVAIGIVGISFSPWLPVAINQTRYHTMPWIQSPFLTEITDSFLRLLLGSGVLAIPGWGRAALVVLTMGLFAWTVMRIRKHEFEQKFEYLSVVIWAFVPLIIIAVISQVYPLFQLKQLLIIVTPLLILSTWITRILPRYVGTFLYIALIVSSVVSLTYQQTTHSKDNWQAAAAYLKDNLKVNDIVYANPAASSLALSLYMDSSFSFDGYPVDYNIIQGGWKGESLSSEKAVSIMKQVTAGRDRVWLVEFFPEMWDPGEFFPAWLIEHGELIEDVRFGNVHLRLFHLSS